MFACAVVAIASYACLGATQVTLRVTTDADCATVRDRGASIYGNDPKLTPAFTETFDCTAGGEINDLGTLVIAPSGDDDDAIYVAVVLGVDVPTAECAAQDYRGCIVAKRRVRYLPHESLEMPVELSLQCKDKVCSPDQTCFRGACVGTTFTSQGGCVGPECSAPAAIGSADASVEDVSVPIANDANTDAAVLVDVTPPPAAVRLLPTFTAPRGLALDNGTLWWTEPEGGDTRLNSVVLANNGLTVVSFDPLITSEAYGVAIFGGSAHVAYVNAPDFCGASFSLTGPESGIFNCAGTSGYIGVAPRGLDVYFSGLFATVSPSYPAESWPAATGYAETRGTVVGYASGEAIAQLDDSRTFSTVACSTGGEPLRGITAFGSLAWLVSTASGRIFVAGEANKTTSQIATTGLTNVEDIAYDENGDRLFMTGSSQSVPGIYVLESIRARVP